MLFPIGGELDESVDVAIPSGEQEAQGLDARKAPDIHGFTWLRTETKAN
jgi:hypothetical protein